MIQMLKFIPVDDTVYLTTGNTADTTCGKIDTYDSVPKEFNIFFRSENQFLPEGKTFDDLTEEEKKDVQNKYRFDPYRPGVYQGITGYGTFL